MQSIIGDIFTVESLKSTKLSENEELLKQLMEQHAEEIQTISAMDDQQIEKTLSELIEDKNSNEFIFYNENLRYLKQSYFIEKKEEEASAVDLEMMKDIRLDEVTDLEDFQNGKLEISFDSVQDLVNRKIEEMEKWKDYNVPATVSNIIGIKETNIEFISSLSAYIAFVSKLDPAVNFVSRGQKNCEFELTPSLHRNHNKDYEIYADNYEGAFKQKILYYDKAIKDKSNEELRAEGQHFGLPTDYLDFTEAHLISLLFAIEDYTYTDQHSIVYFIDSVEYNGETVGAREKLINYSDSAVVESMRRYSSRSYFIKLGNSNERIHFQKGCFLKFSPQDKQEFKKRLRNYGKAVIINKDKKKVILKELFNLGISFENIYPDKDNVVKSIKFHQKEMLGGND